MQFDFAMSFTDLNKHGPQMMWELVLVLIEVKQLLCLVFSQEIGLSLTDQVQHLAFLVIGLLSLIQRNDEQFFVGVVQCGMGFS